MTTMRHFDALLLILCILFILKKTWVGSNKFDICNITVKEFSEISDLIFTGKIESLLVDDNQSKNNKFIIINIKRVIKLNDKYFQNIASGRKVSIKLSIQFFYDSIGYEFMNKLSGCSENSIFNDVRIRDTKIFCGKLVEKNDIVIEQFSSNRIYFPKELLGVSLPLNLQILDQFAALEGMIHK